ncbi:GLPGLI family protein [Mucilaginibacter ginkgonis]|uniref:GLPGLI family protein n=1 Tax=Mucilaginibacter ginkgonis TaxID=2682091 RepID=A0A7T7FB50_9SPHI|nr:GLPGLI family protein [Mucilaginibacter ginkgonis]QQL50133.1 GLPGLI family protein [Mucilaginibacter ginkgonis]
MKFPLFKILSLWLVFSSQVFAQKPEPVVLQVVYKFTHQYDTTDVNRIKVENYVLLVGQTSSAYKSFDRVIQDSIAQASYKLTGMMGGAAGLKRTNSDELYFYFSPEKAYLKTGLLGNYIIERPFNKLQWSILKETKRIANLVCQKATASYMGRKYTAWFDTEYPFKAGPWKLHGLPGLIVSAADETGRIRFELASIRQVKDLSKSIEWDKSAKSITYEQYQNIAKSFENDPKAAMESMFNVKITTGRPMAHKNLLIDKNINFPLEVPPSKK